jgi:hypothetical protein
MGILTGKFAYHLGNCRIVETDPKILSRYPVTTYGNWAKRAKRFGMGNALPCCEA